MYETELYHHGVKGMKWGVRKDSYAKRIIRGHAGPGVYLTRKRQLAGDKRDLEELKKGEHLSVGLTKKRQAALDARDKAALEKRIALNEMSKEDRKARKVAIKDTAKKLKKQASFTEKILYNDATRKKAAEFIIDNNMSVSEATKKANRIARWNTAIILAAVGGYAATSTYYARRGT